MKVLPSALTLCFGLIGATATAAPVTYNFDETFASYDNNSDGSPASFSPGGQLTGTLTLDAALTGNARVVDYALGSFLPGPGNRTASYDSSVSGNNFSLNSSSGSTILSLVSPISSTAERLRLDFGSNPLGGSSLAFTASETYFNCGTVFWAGTPRNSCTLPNSGIGLGTGRAGSNQATQMTVSSVPLPAALPLFVSALAGLGLVARRRG